MSDTSAPRSLSDPPDEVNRRQALIRASARLFREQGYEATTVRDIADGAAAQGVKIARSQVELDKPIKTLGAHKITIHLHAEVTVEITVLVARSQDEAQFLAKGGTLVAETERAAMEAAEAAQRAAAQAAALFEAKAAAAAAEDGEAAGEEAPAEAEEK